MKTISCDICGKTVEPEDLFAVTLNNQEEVRTGFQKSVCAFSYCMDTCRSCAETISQAIADEVKGIKERVADTLKTNE